MLINAGENAGSLTPRAHDEFSGPFTETGPEFGFGNDEFLLRWNLRSLEVAEEGAKRASIGVSKKAFLLTFNMPLWSCYRRPSAVHDPPDLTLPSLTSFFLRKLSVRFTFPYVSNLRIKFFGSKTLSTASSSSISSYSSLGFLVDRVSSSSVMLSSILIILSISAAAPAELSFLL